jgi:hypothetical protein
MSGRSSEVAVFSSVEIAAQPKISADQELDQISRSSAPLTQ